MTEPSKREIQVMRLSLGLSGLPCNDAAAETVILVLRHMKRLKDKFSIKEASDIEYHIQQKYNSNKIIVEATPTGQK